MRQFSSLLTGLARTLSAGKANPNGEQDGREAMKSSTVLKSSGTVIGEGSSSFVSAFSRRGEKGVNQDCLIVWEGFGCQEDTIFCGVFDGHGPWGHYVAKRVRESLPPSLLCNWQKALALSSTAADEKLCRFDLWKQSHLTACATVDKELERHRGLDAFLSGTTSLTLIRQGDLAILANIGDSRAVLATTSENGSMVAVQLTVDFKPNLPQEAERITRCNGLVFCLRDEPGVHRLWLPSKESPGLAMSRAFGDFCVKDYGLVSMPDVIQRKITNGDQFIILATDGVWDVVTNEEAVQVVAATKERGKSAKRLAEYAVSAWRCKRKGFAVDDCSVICLFLHPFTASVC